MVIFWFRRDLRIDDNTGLYEALTSGKRVLPVFIFDKNILSELPEDDARVTFIHKLIGDINTELHKHKRSLAVFYDTPENVFKKLCSENDIKAVYTNTDYEPYARERDKKIANQLRKVDIDFHACKDQVIFEKDEIVKNDGDPYVVYTPYKNKWRKKFTKNELRQHHPDKKLKDIAEHEYPFLSLKDIGFKKSDIQPKPYDISKNIIDNYNKKRNFPAKQATSNISPYLRFGAVSIRELVKKAYESSDEVYLNELIWREFFMQILWHYPKTVTKSFRAKYDDIKWRNNKEEFEAWCNGKTGYAMVDAGMRELNKTGNMHNRVRLVVSGFLCKHLLIDWRWGEAYFAEKLLDYEQSSNVGNWQWAAGSGVDAAPYFRIFNPMTQIDKFDKDNTYIKKWVPEFKDDDYTPIVDHKEARERALETYKKAVS